MEAFERAKKKVEDPENKVEEKEMIPKFTYKQLQERYEKYKNGQS